MQTAISNPHGNHKLKIYNRYTKKKNETKHNINVNYQITTEENKR